MTGRTWRAALGGALAGLMMSAIPGHAEDGMFTDFSGADGSGWRFFTDQVMGGVSEGQARIEEIGGERALRLTGTVSTENRGGFIQARLDLDAPLAPDAEGIVLRVRGDGQRYYVHLRTSGTMLPWQYYQVPFETDGGVDGGPPALGGVRGVRADAARRPESRCGAILGHRGLRSRSCGRRRGFGDRGVLIGRPARPVVSPTSRTGPLAGRVVLPHACWHGAPSCPIGIMPI